MIKKVLRIMTIILFIILGISLIRIGIYFEKISNPKYIYKTGIDVITTKMKDVISVDNKYILGDNFNVSGNMTFKVSSDEYIKKAQTDSNYLKKNNLVNNFNKMNIEYNYIQNRKDKMLLFSLKENNPQREILNYKMLVNNSTEYFFVEEIINNYINDGSNNYFEMFQDKETTVSNIDYMYSFLSDSLAEELGKEAEKYKSTTTVNNSKQELNQVSVKLNNKVINNILTGILEDIKKDEKANQIMKSIDSDFSKRKIQEKAYLTKKESYTINVYCSKYLNTPLKYEIIHMNDNKKEIYSYEGNKDKGLFYYSENNDLKYSANYIATSKTIDIQVYDKYQKDIGSIKLNKDNTSTILNVSLSPEKSNYDIVYSKKYKNYKQNKSYDIEDSLIFKIISEKETRLTGDITANTTVSTETIIEENIDNAVFKSKLTDEQKEKFDKLYNNVKRRLENE